MGKTYSLGKGGMTLAAASAAAMCVLSFLIKPEHPLPGMPGLCLPPPSEWEMEGWLSWLLNALLLGTGTIAIWLLNRTFNFIKTTKPVLPALFIVMGASTPWITVSLSTSMLMLTVNVISLWLLFGCYDSPNATQQMFVTATFISIGSMFQYAFLPMGIWVLIAAVILKIFRPKEVSAFILGLLAPYWIAIGFGWINFSEFRLPAPAPLFGEDMDPTDLFVIMLSTGFAIFIGIAIGISNSLRIYAGNSKVIALNSIISWLGIVCAVCIVIDFNNILTYLATLYFAVAVQFANLCALRQFRHEWLVIFLPAAVYIFFFLLFII